MTGYDTFLLPDFLALCMFNYLLLTCLIRKTCGTFWMYERLGFTVDSTDLLGHLDPAMASDGLSGQKIPEEYGKAAPFFRLGALIVA